MPPISMLGTTIGSTILPCELARSQPIPRPSRLSSHAALAFFIAASGGHAQPGGMPRFFGSFSVTATRVPLPFPFRFRLLLRLAFLRAMRLFLGLDAFAVFVLFDRFFAFAVVSY